MQFSRAFFPLLFTLLLLFAQQGGALHALHHALAEHAQQEHDKHTPHSSACGYCAAYTQLGGVLGSSPPFFAVTAIPSGMVRFNSITFRSNQPLVAFARSPPGFLQETA